MLHSTCALPEALLVKSLSYGSPSQGILLQQDRVSLLHVVPQGRGHILGRLVLLAQLLLAEIHEVEGTYLQDSRHAQCKHCQFLLLTACSEHCKKSAWVLLVYQTGAPFQQ